MYNRRKLILALTVIFTLNIMIIALAQRADAVTYAKGSSGETVREIQQLLLDWGYYSGEVDGIFGSRTEDAVEYFQRKNGLTVDGKVGPATLEALGISGDGTSSASGGQESGELALLARLISAEARGEPYAGQVAVGAVVLNRVEHPVLPEHDIRGHLPARRLQLHAGRPVGRARGRQRLSGRPRRPRRSRPLRRRHLLLQPGHGHQRLDLVQAGDNNHRQTPLLCLMQLRRATCNEWRGVV